MMTAMMAMTRTAVVMSEIPRKVFERLHDNSQAEISRSR